MIGLSEMKVSFPVSIDHKHRLLKLVICPFRMERVFFLYKYIVNIRMTVKAWTEKEKGEAFRKYGRIINRIDFEMPDGEVKDFYIK